MRSKTAKIKFNSDIQNNHTLALNPNFLIGRQFVPQHNTQKVNHKVGGNT